MRKIAPLLAAAFISSAPHAQTPPESVTVTLPEGQKIILCNKLTPERKLTLEFLLQMHDHADGYSAYMRQKSNTDLQAASQLIHHLTAHGVKKAEITRAMQGCGVTNVQYSP